MEYARNMFLPNFYLCGMSFVNMAYLQREDLKNGILIYRRKKDPVILAKWLSCFGYSRKKVCPLLP